MHTFAIWAGYFGYEGNLHVLIPTSINGCVPCKLQGIHSNSICWYDVTAKLGLLRCRKKKNLLGSKSNGKLQFLLTKSYNDVRSASVNSTRQLLQQPGFSWSMHEGRPVAISSHYTKVKSRNHAKTTVSSCLKGRQCTQPGRAIKTKPKRPKNKNMVYVWFNSACLWYCAFYLQSEIMDTRRCLEHGKRVHLSRRPIRLK